MSELDEWRAFDRAIRDRLPEGLRGHPDLKTALVCAWVRGDTVEQAVEWIAGRLAGEADKT